MLRGPFSSNRAWSRNPFCFSPGRDARAARKTLLFLAAPRKNKPMLAELLFELIEFAVRTVVLLGLLWVMIKLQRFNRKYEYRFLRLLLVAALASVWGMVPYAGPFLAIPILWVGVKKVTHADYVETLLTIAIPCALVFGANHFLLRPIKSDLRERIKKASAFEAITRPRTSRTGPATVNDTNSPAAQTNLSALQTNAPGTNLVGGGAITNLAAPPAKPASKLAKYISVKGVTRNAANSSANIQAGTRTYTVFLEEATLMQTPEGPVSVRFAELSTNSVTLEINGEPAKFMVR
jgi:hypothetical protein